MKKQTAVEWFITNIAENGLFNVSTSDAIKNLNNSMKIEELEEKAKAMEKDQIIEAWMATDNPLQRVSAEQYYNETFKNK